MTSEPNIEVEVKIRILGRLSKTRGTLREAGFSIHKSRVFEKNIVFDTPDFTLGKSGRALRIRRAGSEYTFTYKGPVAGGKFKSREEIETQAASFDKLECIILKLGYVPVFRYEKYRTEYRKGKAGVVTLDETPVGIFLELEGEPLWIDRTAAKLGFCPADYITQSYAALYRVYCQEHGLKPGDMVF